MIVYNYRAETGEYAGQEHADTDPLQAGEFLVPAYATPAEPPEASESECAVFSGGRWSLVPDWRGHVYWLPDGSRHEITELGAEPPTEALDEAPPEPIADVSRKAVARVNAGYTQALASILDQYPDAETLSFDKQEREAREWQAWHDADGNNGQGSEPATPYLDAMLAERPIGKAELVGRIIIKADAFVAAHGNATGRRQRLEDDIKAARQAEDRAALEAIDW